MTSSRPGETITITAEGAPTGLTGTIGIRIMRGATEIVPRTTDGIVEAPAGSGIYTIELPAPDEPGHYLIVWDTNGSDPIFATELLEVGPLPSDPTLLAPLAEIKRLLDITGSEYDGELSRLAAIVGERIENACGVAFTPREATETVQVNRDTAVLSHPKVIEITRLDGEDVTLPGSETGTIPLPAGEHQVTYQHGWEETPLPIQHAVMLLVRYMWEDSPTDYDQRATSMTTEMATWSLVTPGVRGAIFPLPEVNQIVAEYSWPGGIH